MIKRTPVTPVSSCETQDYAVEFPEGLTVKEFFDDLISEYPAQRYAKAYIFKSDPLCRVNNHDIMIEAHFGKKEFKRGKDADEGIYTTEHDKSLNEENILDKRITAITANGGRGFISYDIRIE